MAIEGMRIQSKADVRLELPILQIVARFETAAGEVRDLIPQDAQRREAIDSRLVQLGREIVARK